MKTYINIEEFISDVFPLEHQIMTRKKPSDIELVIEEADAEFRQKLDAIIKGENTE